MRPQPVQPVRDRLGALAALTRQCDLARLLHAIPLRFKPHFKQSDLPQFGAAQRDVIRRLLEQAVKISILEEAPLARLLRAQGIADQIEIRTGDIFELRHREIAFLAVDDLARNDPARHVLQNALAAVAQLLLRGMRAASSTSSWSRKGTRASRPQAMVILSTRFTGSSTSITLLSRRSA